MHLVSMHSCGNHLGQKPTTGFHFTTMLPWVSLGRMLLGVAFELIGCCWMVGGCCWTECHTKSHLTHRRNTPIDPTLLAHVPLNPLRLKKLAWLWPCIFPFVSIPFVHSISISIVVHFHFSISIFPFLGAISIFPFPFFHFWGHFPFLIFSKLIFPFYPPPAILPLFG